MTRIKAFMSHLAISLVIFLVLLYFIVFIWYPQPFFSTDGGWQGIRLIAIVDIVLGPLLTLVVFKPGKPGLKFDMTVIALVQLSALSWGIWTTYNQRPAAVIYTEYYFTPVPLQDLKEIDISRQMLSQYGEQLPVYIYSNLPKDFDAMQKVRATVLRTGKPLHLFKEYYGQMDEASYAEINASSIVLEDYFKDETEKLTMVKNRLEQLGVKRDETIFIPFHSRFKRVVGVFNKQNLQLLDILDIELDIRKYKAVYKKPAAEEKPKQEEKSK